MSVRPLSLAKGTTILCANGHHVATTNRDIYKGDNGYSTAFDFEPDQVIAKKGDPVPIKCYCDGIWFADSKCPYVK